MPSGTQRGGEENWKNMSARGVTIVIHESGAPGEVGADLGAAILKLLSDDKEKR